MPTTRFAPNQGGPHRPGPGRPLPVSTYRLQMHGGFGFDAVAEQAPYLASLGISHLYLSPILASAPGSTHGYDVVDHTNLNEELGGREAFDRLVSVCREHGLGVVVDVVPNHMTVPSETYLNAPLWDLLRKGRGSEYADWFDIDWEVDDPRILMPVLGQPLQDALRDGQITLARDGGVDSDEVVLRYFDHEFPVAADTVDLPLEKLVERQPYRLAFWEEGSTDLNYRRFFDVTTLKAVRVEDDDVFDATHELLLKLWTAKAIHGFRIDHPDGLADPGGYLARLAARTKGAWVVAEKILEGEELLPDDWECSGTTGYDALLRVQQVLTDGTGTALLTELWSQAAAELADLDEVIIAAKQHVVDEVQAAEVNRLMRLLERVLPESDPAALRTGLRALLVSMDRYRAYIVPGQRPQRSQLVRLARAEARAKELTGPDGHEGVALVAQVARGGRLPQAAAGEEAREAAAEFIIRFQQTCGPVMAKGIEDTAFYRWLRLSGANEVGGHPGELSIENDEFHDFAERQLDTWPATMTTLSTHDTKRSEDVRARLASMAELAPAWAQWWERAQAMTAQRVADADAGIDRGTIYLIWQTAVGAWPIDGDRMETYLLKAVREAKLHTAWVDGDAEYEARVVALARAVVTDAELTAHVTEWVHRSAATTRAFSLGQKLIQLTMPGVPDVYQGAELPVRTLVDPDNRGDVDYADRAARLARLDEGQPPADEADEKLLVTSRALRLRREHPEWFTGPDALYQEVLASTSFVTAFARGIGDEVEVVVVAARSLQRLADEGGWDGATIEVPVGEWRDLLSGNEFSVAGEAGVASEEATDGPVEIETLLAALPVALLVRT